MKRFCLPAILLGTALLASCNSAPSTGTSRKGTEPGGDSGSSLNLTVSRTVTLGLPDAPGAEILVPATLASKVTAQVEGSPAGLTVTAGKPTQLSTGDTAVPLSVSGTAQPGEVVRVKVTLGAASSVAELPVYRFRGTPIQATGLTASYPASSIRFQPDGTALMTASMNGERAARQGLVQTDAAGTAFTLLPFPQITAVGDAISSQAIAPDGSVWVTVRGSTGEGSFVLSRDQAGTVQKYAVNAQKDSVNSATVADGRVWFTQYTNAALKALTPGSGQVQAYPVAEKAESLVRGSDGNLYYASVYARPAIVQVDPGSGQTRSFNVGEANSTIPMSLTASPDGCLWFIQSPQGGVWQLNPTTGTQTPLALPLNVSPNALAVSPGGQLWISDATNARLYTTYRTSSGQQALIGISTPGTGAEALSIHPSGKAWFEAGGVLYVQQ